MQPRPDPPAARGDEDTLYRRHHGTLHRAVARRINGSPELIEDACQFAWLKLIDT
jgi:DNA-directed RNA polymerase specialized sigma24 family protein